jgi:hypothetical protein
MQASNNQQDDGQTVGLSWALIDHSRRAMPIERASALGNSRLAVSKSGARFSCREGLQTLDEGIEGRNLHSSEFLSKFYAVRAADKTRTLGDLSRKCRHFRVRQKLLLKTSLCVFPTRWPDTRTCRQHHAVSGFFLCVVFCVVSSIADMSIRAVEIS